MLGVAAWGQFVRRNLFHLSDQLTLSGLAERCCPLMLGSTSDIAVCVGCKAAAHCFAGASDAMAANVSLPSTVK